MFLLDTSVLSEAQRTKPMEAVERWLRRQQSVAIPFPVILEIEQGIVEVGKTKPNKANELREWLSTILASDYEYPDASPKVAAILAEMTCCNPLKNFWFVNPEGKKEKKPSQDLFIAAVSIVHGLPLATMNDRDFMLIDQFFPIPGVYNPGSGRWVVGRPNIHKHDFIVTELRALETIFENAIRAGEKTISDICRVERATEHTTLPRARLGRAPSLPAYYP